MSEQGSRAVDSDRFHDPKPFVDPFDPVALAARLAEARAQRAVALAKRDQEARRPGEKPLAPQAKVVRANAWRAGESALPKARPEPKVLRADPGMRAVPVRAGEPQRPGEERQPARSARAVVLAAFIAGCVTVGLAALALAPWFSPQDVTKVTAPPLDVVAEPAPAQVAAPEALAPSEAGRSIGLPDPVPLFSPRSVQDRPSDSDGFVRASGGEAATAIAATAPPGLPRPKPQALTAPEAPPSPTLFAPYAEAARLLARPPQLADAADGADEVMVARPPAVFPVPLQTIATAPSSPGVDAAGSGVPRSAAAAARVTVFYPSGAGAEAVAALAAIAGLASSGAASTAVGHNIGRTNVRYYHDADLQAARAVAGALSAESRDFTDFRPRPEPGTIEVWLAGEAASAGPAVAAAPRPERAAAALARSAPRSAPELRASVNAEDQQRLEQQVQRLLREQLRELRRR